MSGHRMSSFSILTRSIIVFCFSPIVVIIVLSLQSGPLLLIGAGGDWFFVDSVWSFLFSQSQIIASMVPGR